LPSGLTEERKVARVKSVGGIVTIVNSLASYTPREVPSSIPPTKITDASSTNKAFKWNVSCAVFILIKVSAESTPPKFKVDDMILRYDVTLDNTHSVYGAKVEDQMARPSYHRIISQGTSVTLQQLGQTPVRRKCSQQEIKAHRGWHA
jgi:hypothetical protein